MSNLDDKRAEQDQYLDDVITGSTKAKSKRLTSTSCKGLSLRMGPVVMEAFAGGSGLAKELLESWRPRYKVVIL